jgi:hypothetical protein
MSSGRAAFSGSIPTCLGPLLFQFSAADLAARVRTALS